MTARRHVIAVDIGGTHTDAALLTAAGDLHVHKVRSTPADPGIALITAIDGLLAASGLAFADIAAVAHGTTIATNAVILGDFARVGMLVSAGFEDILEIGTQQRPDLYDPWRGKPAPIVPRARVHGIAERVASDGAVVVALDEDQVRAAARALASEVDAVAIVFLFSFADPTHERRAAELVREELPGIPVTISSVVAPEFREYPRAVTTALNAALLPRSGGYIDRLDARLRDRGFAGAFQLMTSTGGVVPASVAKEIPVSLLVSGPAAGAVAAAELGRRLGERDLVMLDVGGTSADVALIEAGQPHRRYRGEVAGMPVALPQLDVLPIGAGGGSLARVDDFGALRVGPDSAGADPGPAAYGVAETAALTDAHIVLGSIDPGGLLGGRLPLQPERSRAAIERHVAAHLGVGAEAAAGAAVRIADGKMADALRLVTVGRGFDVRRCALIAFGGAGPLHACAIADDLGIGRVIVPRYPGLTSALGLLMGDGSHELRRTYVAPFRAIDHDRLDVIIGELIREGTDALGDGAEAPTLSLDLDLRFAGQAYELTVPVSEDCSFGPDDLDRVEGAFRAAHESAYGHSWPHSPVELVTVRVRARVSRVAVDWIGGDTRAPIDAPESIRRGWTSSGQPVDYRVLDRAAVTVGLAGPALIQQTDTTTLIPHGWWVARVDGVGMVLERMPEQGAERMPQGDRS
ncbi:hydantoinase/oxoprolinase family protein [Microbacterium rhizomatis]|uniref:Hydantoinase/oxoprolinase family protein n=1 Tax=Microbacterium rhizomatis TaxID=1631477 RepID=A0A5J5J3J0_9MICO|nr:hydantoinase/oxoprolinase family protein [Microbacterium rhizomatis]KAA9108010.1 hydantoinase/oxoprolinase family protein [Microbacterium rhizomatis]